MMCEWMGKNHMLIDLYGDNPVPEVIVDSDIMRRITLDAMFDMLVESTAAASGQTNVEAKTAGITRGSISNLLNAHFRKIKGTKNYKRKTKSYKRKNRMEDDVVEKLWDLGDWEKLVLLYDYLKWWKYCEFLAQYYNQNSFKFLLDPEVVYRRCLETDEELVSMWPCRQGDAFSISTIIQSSLIKEHVAIWGIEDDYSKIAFSVSPWKLS